MTERMDSIYKKDKEENKEFDEAVKDGDLDSLREGVKIRQKQNLNPINAISELAGTWDTGRREHIENIAQGTDKFVTNLTGNEWIGDRARNIAGFATDITYPESWELPLMATAAAIPIDGPLGEASIYGTGVINRGRRLFKQGGQAVAANFANVINDVWQSGTRWTRDKFGSKQLVTPDGMVMRYGPDDLPPDFIPGNVSRPLPGEKHVSGLVPRISGNFNGKAYNKSTLSLDPNDLIEIRTSSRPDVGVFTQAGEGTAKTQWNEFNKLGRRIVESNSGLSKIFSEWAPKVKGKSNWRFHHTAPIKQLGYAVNGLNKEAREDAAEYISNRIGSKIGLSKEQLSVVPDDLHVLIHRSVNDMLGRGYTIKNIEKKLGLNPGEFSKLELWEREEGFNMIADAILESKAEISKFYQYASTQITDQVVDPEIFVDVMEQVLELNTKYYMIDPKGYKSLTDLVDKMVGRKGIINEIIGNTPKGMTNRPRSIAEQNALINRRLGEYTKIMEMKIRRGSSIPPVDSIWNLGQDN